jgi:hypothetical protein
MSIRLATWEAEIGKILIPGQLRQKVKRPHLQKQVEENKLEMWLKQESICFVRVCLASTKPSVQTPVLPPPQKKSKLLAKSKKSDWYSTNKYIIFKWKKVFSFSKQEYDLVFSKICQRDAALII